MTGIIGYEHGGYLKGAYKIDDRINPAEGATYNEEVLSGANSIVFHMETMGGYNRTGQVYVFSNYAKGFPITLGKDVYPTSEHYYHIQKLDPTHADYQRLKSQCLAESDLNVVRKRFSSKGDIKPGSGSIPYKEVGVKKVEWMRDALYYKYTQNPDALRTLLATGDKQLIEVAHYDDFWGTGKYGTGQNMLGKCLMDLRATIFDQLKVNRAYFKDYYNKPDQVEALIKHEGKIIGLENPKFTKAREATESEKFVEKKLNERFQPKGQASVKKVRVTDAADGNGKVLKIYCTGPGKANYIIKDIGSGRAIKGDKDNNIILLTEHNAQTFLLHLGISKFGRRDPRDTWDVLKFHFQETKSVKDAPRVLPTPIPAGGQVARGLKAEAEKAHSQKLEREQLEEAKRRSIADQRKLPIADRLSAGPAQEIAQKEETVIEKIVSLAKDLDKTSANMNIYKITPTASIEYELFFQKSASDQGLYIYTKNPQDNESTIKISSNKEIRQGSGIFKDGRANAKKADVIQSCDMLDWLVSPKNTDFIEKLEELAKEKSASESRSSSFASREDQRSKGSFHVSSV